MAGTGISGALAIAESFLESSRQPVTLTKSALETVSQLSSPVGDPPKKNSQALPELLPLQVWRKCVVVWTVKSEAHIDIPGLEAQTGIGLDVIIHRSDIGKLRISLDKTLDSFLAVNQAAHEQSCSTWVYISGPNAFIIAGESACKQRRTRGIEYYGARWEV